MKELKQKLVQRIDYTCNNKKLIKGFTLIELLIVVVIIGILAGIALPQYQIAVEKAKFSEVKTMIRTIYDAEQRYFIIHNNYPSSIDDLDVNFNNVKSKLTYNPGDGSKAYRFSLSNGVNCDIWGYYLTCGRIIFGQTTKIYADRNTSRLQSCVVFGGKDPTSKANYFCSKDTGRVKNTSGTNYLTWGYR